MCCAGSHRILTDSFSRRFSGESPVDAHPAASFFPFVFYPMSICVDIETTQHLTPKMIWRNDDTAMCCWHKRTMSSKAISDEFAVCEACGSIYVARMDPDGTLRPIGVGNDCTCGDGSFRRFGE